MRIYKKRKRKRKQKIIQQKIEDKEKPVPRSLNNWTQSVMIACINSESNTKSHNLKMEKLIG